MVNQEIPIPDTPELWANHIRKMRDTEDKVLKGKLFEILKTDILKKLEDYK